MPILLSDYDKLLECKGNKHNKIFIVQHKETKERCIFKAINLYDKDSQLREVEVHKKLNHKYVIKLLDYELSGDKIIMLIELAKYGDLYSMLKKMGQLGERRILKLYYRVLKALQYLHANNVVHRDLKPENVLVTDKLKPKLADFGTSANKNLIANTFCGTYEYMAPEVYLRCKQDDKVDVWAAGILLYEILHRQTPFKKETLQSIKDKLDRRSVYFRPGIGREIQDFIYYALRFNPKDRPTVNQLLNHKLFDSVRSKKKVLMSEVSRLDLVCRSERELEGMRTRSQPDSDSAEKKTVRKFGVHQEIFDTETTSQAFPKTLESLYKKVGISDKAKKKKGKDATRLVTSGVFKFKQLPVIRPTDRRLPHLDKPKTLHNGTIRSDGYSLFSLYKKPEVATNKTFDKNILAKTLMPRLLAHRSSIDKSTPVIKNVSLKSTGERQGLKGFLMSMQEKKSSLRAKITMFS